MTTSELTERVLNLNANFTNTALQWVRDNSLETTIAVLILSLILPLIFNSSFVIAPIVDALGFTLNGVGAG